MLDFFDDSDFYTGPRLEVADIRAAEAELGYKLPAGYVQLLLEKNGGKPKSRCFPVSFPNSWAADHVEIRAILGIGGKWGIVGPDTVRASDYLVREWGYPDIGIVFCEMPSAGPDAIMLDYTELSISSVEPRVVYVDVDQSVHVLASDFDSFLGGLRSCDQFD
jgi:hypothetical protein